MNNDTSMKVMDPDLWGDGSISPTWGQERTNLMKRQFELEQEINRQRIARKWYMVVIVLLYVGLLASFSLNVSLLLRKPQTKLLPPDLFTEPTPHSVLDSVTTAETVGHNGGGGEAEFVGHNGGGVGAGEWRSHASPGFAYTTPCLVAVPCEAGEFYDCATRECRSCPKGTYQPHWGQTSCWSCPSNSTTDLPAASEITACKRQDCPFYTRDGVGIMESPNFPRHFPTGVNCRWRLRPGHTRRVILILPQLSLPSDCSAKLVIRQQSETIFNSCLPKSQPSILTGHSNNLWIEFSSGPSTDLGFQLTVLSVEEELGYLVDAVVNAGDISSFDKNDHSSLTQEDKILLSRLLLLLNPTYPSNYDGRSKEASDRKRKPVIEVLEENERVRTKT